MLYINNRVSHLSNIMQQSPKCKAYSRSISPYLKVSLRCIPDLVVKHSHPLQVFDLICKPKKVLSHALIGMTCNFVIGRMECRFEEGGNVEPPICISKNAQPSMCCLLAWGRRIMDKMSDGIDKLGFGISWQSDSHS